MQFNKCCRCGCFFVSSGDVCPNCASRDNFEMQTLKNFLEDYDENCSLENISYNTGISVKNLNRFLEKDSFSDFSNKFNTINNNITNL